MIWTVIVAKSAQKELEKLPARDRDRVAAALLQMATDPFRGDVRKLEGLEDRWRRRVGNYRIFFAAKPSTWVVAISAVVRRTSTTY
jgi:mRNA interferase RelE/StbE